MRPKWLTEKDAGKEIGVSDRTIRRLCKEGRLIWAKFRGCRRIFAKSLDHYAMLQAAEALRDCGVEISPELKNEIEEL